MHLHIRQTVTQKLWYRPDIDGLRAVAVLSVVLFHYGAPIRGGFTGVDVFFVISGFLITQTLAAEIAAGSFSIIGFYDRRIRRILPALLVMLAASLLAGALLLSPGDYTTLGTTAAMATFGVSNFFFYDHTGYFDRTSDLLPLLHTWSLAVEEQFYLVWPVLLYGLSLCRSRGLMAAALAVIVVAVCAGSIVYFRVDPKGAFYLAPPRAWELAIGALLVFLPPMRRAAGEIAAVAGLILIGIGFTISPAKFPGEFALYPCIGAALIVWPRNGQTTSSEVLGALAPIGLISYSLYLWHWPIWVLYRIYINGGLPGTTEAAILAIISVLIATLSYRYVEKPFRVRRWKPLQTVGVGIAAMLAMSAAGFSITAANGLPQRLPAEAQPLRDLTTMWDWPCKEATIDKFGRYCVFGAPWETARHKSMIWGDSHAEHIAPIIEAASRDPDRSFLVFAGCSAVLGDGNFIIMIGNPDYPQRCQRIHAGAMTVLEDSAIDQVILTSSWLELPRRIGNDDERRGAEAMREALAKLVGQTSIPGRQFILIGGEPELPLQVVECAHARLAGLWRAPCEAGLGSTDARTLLQRSAVVDDIFTELARTHPNVATVFPARRLCRDDGCDVSLDGEFLYRDPSHIRRNLKPQTRRDFADRIGLTAALNRQ
ncbi:putative acyltransferase [Bradyrhizobium sp. YR681]|uniref:acyltransferase family protein n=1 Tax=Bradyrhizobium sp. YR681 TaxID=1144344 RepID=UPI0002714894|nr:acyltransferase family protein [Bradyrhizobium sp. YR681]EJN13985.1 putative acyltransferase [Bradyrhizobium sp. YR681]